MAKAGHIDLLVNNAGVGLVGAAEESSLEQAKSVFDVNLFGVIRMTNSVLPVMREQRSGHTTANRYTTSAFMRMKLGASLPSRNAAAHVFETHAEAMEFLGRRPPTIVKAGA